MYIKIPFLFSYAASKGKLINLSFLFSMFSYSFDADGKKMRIFWIPLRIGERSTSTGVDRLAIVLGGSLHFTHGLGTPYLVKKKIPSLKDRIIMLSNSGDLVLSKMEKALSRDIKITHEDLRFLQTPIADYINVIEFKTEKK